MDSLTTGVLAPGTAVSQFLELGRLLATHYKKWKPRRTVVFAAWDAEQFGHIGATEYIEVRSCSPRNVPVMVVINV